MIDLLFKHASEIVIVRIENKIVLFGSTMYGAKLASIDGLKLDFRGTIKQFPDLDGDLQWREKAVQRFKEHIATLDSEDSIADYIIGELSTKGYIPTLKQKKGFRPEKI